MTNSAELTFAEYTVNLICGKYQHAAQCRTRSISSVLGNMLLEIQTEPLKISRCLLQNRCNDCGRNFVIVSNHFMSTLLTASFVSHW